MIIDSPVISGSLDNSGSLSQLGNVTITGSLTVTGDIVGNITGSASSASQAVSSSYSLSSSYAATASYALNVPVTAAYADNANTASYAVFSNSASYALTASYISGSGMGVGFPFSGAAVITGSLLITNLTGSGVRYLVSDELGNITAQSASAAIKTTQTVISTAGQTLFNITNGYTTGLIDVFINGTKLNEDEFTDTDGITITLATGSAVDDVVEFVKYLPASGVSSNVLRQLTTFTATAGQTVFSASYTPGLLDVYYNGARLSTADYTANNGVSIALATASIDGDILDVMVYSYQVGAMSGIGGQGTAGQIAYFGTNNSITGSPNFSIVGDTINVTGSFIVSSSSTFVNIGPTVMSGSLNVSGSLMVGGSEVLLTNQTSSLVATNAVSALTASSADSFLVRGNLTAQTLVVQTITSSVDFVTGSTRFGSISENTHQFTGSISVTGSMSVNGALSGTSVSMSSTVSATGFIRGGTPSNTGGFSNSYYAESNVPSLTLSNTGTNTGKYTLGVTNGAFGLWNNTTSAYEIYVDPVSANNITFVRGISGTSLSMSLGGTFGGNVGIGISPSRKFEVSTGVSSDSAQNIARFGALNISSENKTFDIGYVGSTNLITLGTNAVGTDPSMSFRIGSTEVAKFGASIINAYTTISGTSLSMSGGGSFGGNVELSGTTTGFYVNNAYPVARFSSFGYGGGSYRGVLIGGTSVNSLFFNVDVSGNPSGAFTGNGNEYVFRNVGSFITPNSTNNGYNTLFGWNTSGQINISGITSIGEVLIAGAATDGTNKLIVNGGVKGDSLYGTTSVVAGALGSALGVDIRATISSALPTSSVKAIIGALNSGFGYSAGTLYMQPRTGVSAPLILGTEGTPRLTIASTGAATFSSVSSDYGLSVTNIKDDSQGLLVRATDNDGLLYLLNLQSSNGATSQTWVDRFVVTKQGNVGIGTTSPTAPLTFANTAGNKIDFYNDPLNNVRYGIKLNAGELQMYTSFSQDIISIYAGNTAGIVVNNGTTLLAGAVTDGTNKLIVNGGVKATSGTFTASDVSLTLTNTSTSRNFLNIQNNSGRVLIGVESSTGGSIVTGAAAYASVIGTPSSTSLQFATNDVIRLTLASTGAATFSSLGTGTVYSNAGTLTNTNPSDKNLKTDIAQITYGLNDILKLNPVTFNWKDDKINQGKQYGFIAQQVQEIMPDLVKDGEYLGLDKEAIFTILVKAVQQQQTLIIELQEKLERNNIL